jgi:S1-C subfamily serine protease
VIVAVDGRRVSSLEELRDELQDHRPGDKVEVEIYRGNRPMTLDVTLGRQPASPQG